VYTTFEECLLFSIAAVGVSTFFLIACAWEVWLLRRGRIEDRDVEAFSRLAGAWSGLDAEMRPCEHRHLSSASAAICAASRGGSLVRHDSQS
jgi:hypothetical protein